MSRASVATFASWFLLNALHSGAQEFATADLAFSLTYYECVDPSQEPPCVCAAAEDKGESCPGCNLWEERHTSISKFASFDAGAYSYSTGLPRANEFVSDVTISVYGTVYPKTGYDYPITTSDLYDNYRTYGWVELEADADKTGSIAVWHGLAGLVVGETGNQVEVLYPSDYRYGTLHVGGASFIAAGEEPRYILPKSFIINVARDSGER